MRNVFLLIIGFFLFAICACSEEEVEYIPIGKKHLGDLYETYTINNIKRENSVQFVALNFYPEEVTDLSCVQYNESACAFTFQRNETANYLISWNYDTEQNYVEVQYGQNAMWYTINGQRHKGEYLLRANDGMAVRIIMRANGYGVYENGEVKYTAGVTVNDFRIEEVARDSYPF